MKPTDQRTLRGPRDCLLRRAILLNKDKIANTLSDRLSKEQEYILDKHEELDLDRLIPVKIPSDIPVEFIRTPIEGLLRAQNMFDIGDDISHAPTLIVGMCIDHRKQIYLPKNGAYIIRSPGANMQGQEYSIALALSAGIKYMALIVHNKCLMTDPLEQKRHIEDALIGEHGWTKEQLGEALDHFTERKIGDPVSFAIEESNRLEKLFKSLKVVPLLYDLFSDRLFIIKAAAVQKNYLSVTGHGN